MPVGVQPAATQRRAMARWTRTEAAGLSKRGDPLQTHGTAAVVMRARGCETISP